MKYFAAAIARTARRPEHENTVKNALKKSVTKLLFKSFRNKTPYFGSEPMHSISLLKYEDRSYQFRTFNVLTVGSEVNHTPMFVFFVNPNYAFISSTVKLIRSRISLFVELKPGFDLRSQIFKKNIGVAPLSCVESVTTFLIGIDQHPELEKMFWAIFT